MPHQGAVRAEPLVLLEANEVEEALRRWSRLVAAESPLPPRLRAERITGWCSWYNLYAAIDEPVILEHLAAAAAFRDARNVPLEVFQIDDGFTPEMGDWLDVKPQFPRGMKALLADIAAAGFTPGLWIAPFLVGNRSRLYADHPDWVVQRPDGDPLVHMNFYGEFRWHKRSEEYYVLDITHPDAADYIRTVFRTWRRDWGAGYFKTDFMNAGMEYGPGEARWHESGLSRVQIWRRMADAHPRGDRGRALARLRMSAMGIGRPGRRGAHRTRHRRHLEWRIFGRQPAARPADAQPRLNDPLASRSRLRAAARPLP